MPTIEQLRTARRWITVVLPVEDGTIEIEVCYQLGRLTRQQLEEWAQEQDINVALAELLVDWNVSDDQGQRLPPTKETLESLGEPVKRVLFAAILEDATQDFKGERRPRGSGSSAAVSPAVPRGGSS